MRNYQTSYKSGLSYKVTITSTGSVRTPVTSSDINVFSVSPTVDCWINVGSSTVTAAASTGSGIASRFCLAGVPIYLNKSPNNKYFAAIANSASGIAVFTEETQ